MITVIGGQIAYTLAGTYFKQGGNSYGALAILGTNDAYDLALETNGAERVRITSTGNVGIGTTGPTAALHLPASSTARASLRIPAGTAPTSPNAGDVWAEGTVIKFYNGTTTKEIAFV